MIRSSIGRKILVAVTGLLLLGFVIAHLLGNLLIFQGPEAINAYALKLRALGPMLWIARIGLLMTLLVHVWTSIQLTIENRRARPQRYQAHHLEHTTFAARTMMISGVLVVVYLIYHLLHFTFHVTNPEVTNLTDTLGHHDVYRMMVLSFQHWPIVLAYLIGVGAVCLHLSHGIGSSAQSLGLNDERTRLVFMRVGQLVSLGVYLGYASIPLAVLFGIVR